MSYFEPIDNNLFKLGDIGTFANRDITEAITDMSVSLTIAGSSQVTVSVVDVDFAMAKANYFQIRRDIFYRDIFFEITSVGVSRSESIHPLYQIECRSKAVQLMKQDKRPEAYNGISAFELAKRMAKRYNMHFFGEETTKKQAVVKAKSSTEDDSVWTVLQSLASEQEFICFESQSTLFFCSEKYLLGKWGDPNFTYGSLQFIPFIWPEPNLALFPEAIDKYILMDMPDVRRSDDDIKAASGSMLVDRVNGKNLRPGMTIFLGGIPDFEGLYLITDISFSEGSEEPVQVQFRTPVEPKKEKISSSGTKPTGTRTLPNSTDPITGVTSGGGSGATLTNTKAYTASVLARTNYSGSNANIIITAVQSAVNFHTNGRTYEQIEKTIRSSTKLTTAEKDLVLQIYTAFVMGSAVTYFAVADGLSATAVQERKDKFLGKEQDTKINVTPATGPETSSEATSGGATQSGQSRLLNIPAQGLPSNVNTLITALIDKRYNFANKVAKQVLVSKAQRAANEIYNLKTKQEKIARYKKVKEENKSFDYQMVYDAIRQQSVVSIIVGPMQGGKTFDEVYPGMPAPYVSARSN